LHCDVGAGAEQHVHVALNVVRLDRALRGRAGRTRERSGDDRELRYRQRRAHRFISRSIVGRYSGYVAGAPPNTASNGKPNCLDQS